MLFESAAVGLVVLSPDGVILRANPALASLLGTEPPALTGRTAAELTHPEDRAETLRVLGELAARRRSHADLQKRYLRTDGSVVWTNMTAATAYGPSGAPTHLIMTVRDLTANRELMEQLRESDVRYRRLVDANILGVAIATETGVLEANDEYLRLAGTTRAEFAARGLDWKSLSTAEQLRRDERCLREIVERGACTTFQKDFVWPDGTRVPVLVGGALLERQPLKWIAFALDLTEQQLHQAERERLMVEAHAARALAEEALAARDALLAQVTHELRTPLAANVGYASMLRDGIPEPLLPAQQDIVRRMLANQHHMLALIDHLLDFASASARRNELDLEVLDVDALLAGVEPLVAPQIRAAGLTYDCPACDSPLSVRADRMKVTQILVNLVGNAVKFTPAGGHITLASSAEGDMVRIVTTDTGTGIPEDQLSRIFEPFVQGPPASGRTAGAGQPRGFGLGLAISRELARSMGGELAARSTPGVGSSFTLVLPRA